MELFPLVLEANISIPLEDQMGFLSFLFQQLPKLHRVSEGVLPPLESSGFAFWKIRVLLSI